MIEYGPATEALRGQALSLLVSQAPDGEKAACLQGILATTRGNLNALDTLLTARQGAALVGSIWGCCLPGELCLVWPARVVDPGLSEIADQLQIHLDQQLVLCGTQIAQVMLANIENDDARRLLRCGYQHAADLLYLVSFLQEQGLRETDSGLEFEPFTADRRERLCKLVQETYVGSMDVPALDGKRDMHDVLAGYEGTGEFSPDRWMFVRSAGCDVGCLFLADHPGSNQYELVYMGLVPEARGNGWGAIITDKAQALAQAAGRARLVLAVDSDNDPAIAAYSKAGFVEWFRRSVLMKTFAA